MIMSNTTKRIETGLTDAFGEFHNLRNVVVAEPLNDVCSEPVHVDCLVRVGRPYAQDAARGFDRGTCRLQLIRMVGGSGSSIDHLPIGLGGEFGWGGQPYRHGSYSLLLQDFVMISRTLHYCVVASTAVDQAAACPRAPDISECKGRSRLTGCGHRTGSHCNGRQGWEADANWEMNRSGVASKKQGAREHERNYLPLTTVECGRSRGC